MRHNIDMTDQYKTLIGTTLCFFVVVYLVRLFLLQGEGFASNTAPPLKTSEEDKKLAQVVEETLKKEKAENVPELTKSNPAPPALLMSNQPQNSFLSSAVGGLLGAGVGGLLGSAAGASLSQNAYAGAGSSDIKDLILHSVISENAALRLSNDEHHEHAAISTSPNSKHMGKYEEQKDTKWTRGGPSMRHRARHRRPSLDRYNEDDPETVRWPGKCIDPPSLHPLRRSTSPSPNSSRGNCKSSSSEKNCDDSEPLNRKFNVERDYSR
jgi:hypothetical protein